MLSDWELEISFPKVDPLNYVLCYLFALLWLVLVWQQFPCLIVLNPFNNQKRYLCLSMLIVILDKISIQTMSLFGEVMFHHLWFKQHDITLKLVQYNGDAVKGMCTSDNNGVVFMEFRATLSLAFLTCLESYVNQLMSPSPLRASPTPC